MLIAVINCGSSSIKADVIDDATGSRISKVRVERLGGPKPTLNGDQRTLSLPDHADHAVALEALLPELLRSLPTGAKLSGVGHRVVHGGSEFSQAMRIDPSVLQAIEALCPLAPLHNPANLAGIRAAQTQLPDVPHVAVFDTAFHATLPRRAQAYALPWELCDTHHLRRFGFHGPSHRYVAERAAAFLRADLRELRLVTCHLGNGCSIAAVEYGRSVETSMGLTPLEGLVMGTRCGDIDPGVLLALMRQEGLDASGLDELLNRQSGLAGVSGVGPDMRDIEARAAEGDRRCRLAIQIFAHRARKYIGAYVAVMGGVDAIVFTGGIGQNSALIRHRIAQRFDFIGAQLEEDKNRDARVDRDQPVYMISSAHSRCHLLVVETDEQRAIAQQTAKLVAKLDCVALDPPAIPVAVSARHVHLTEEHVATLFGLNHALTLRKPLTQPGQFAAEETVTLIGPKRSIENVRVLGPTRSKTQVEISRTDEFHLGLDAPVRRSGDIDNTPGITLVGPKGRVELKKGVICAWRHIHMQPEDAERLGVTDRDVVEVAIESEGRDLVFGDVLVRVSPSYRLEMHIDTDEGNAAELQRGAQGALIETSAKAQLRRKRT